MPDEQKSDEQQPAQSPLVLQMPFNIPTIYASGWATRVGQSDFTIQFGLNPSDNSDGNLDPVANIVLTHGNLLKLAMNIAGAARIVQKLYGDNNVPLLADFTREKLEEAVKEVEAEQAEMQRRAFEQVMKTQAEKKVD